MKLLLAAISIVAALYGLWTWIRSLLVKRNRPSGVFVKEGNIYLIYSTGITNQITFINSDSNPILGRRLVVFFRREKDAIGGRFKLMTIDLKTLKELLITDQKPFACGNDNSYYILQPGENDAFQMMKPS